MARIGKWTTVSVDDSGGTARDVSAQVTEITGIGVVYDEIESSGFTQDHGYIAGQADVDLQITFKFNDTASTGTHTVLSGINGTNTAGTVTIQLGDNATPTSGDPEFEGEFICTSYVPTVDKGGLQGGTAKFRQREGATLAAWGTVA